MVMVMDYGYGSSILIWINPYFWANMDGGQYGWSKNLKSFKKVQPSGVESSSDMIWKAVNCENEMPIFVFFITFNFATEPMNSFIFAKPDDGLESLFSPHLVRCGQGVSLIDLVQIRCERVSLKCGQVGSSMYSVSFYLHSCRIVKCIVDSIITHFAI